MAADELNCSDGAKMLIERMQSNPEEFRGGAARWATVMNQMLQVRRGAVENNVFMSRRDMNALFDAFEKHVMETSLAEHVIKKLMEPKAERKKVQVKRASPITAAGLTDEALKILEAEYRKVCEDAEADRLRYKAADRYDLPWDIKHGRPQT